MNYLQRLEWFEQQKHKNRFWWFQSHHYLPEIYATLTDNEFALLQDWFVATENAGMVGEVNVPAISTMLGFINGSGLDTIVQLGHFAGYSTLFFGWALKKMGGRQLLSIDINPKATKFTQKWIETAGLNDYVTLLTLNSTSVNTIHKAGEVLVTRPKMIFVDSSHQYENTLLELDYYYTILKPGGLIFLHDVSVFARKFDKTEKGGVNKAMLEWATREPGLGSENIMLNRWIEGQPWEQPLVVWDGCGLGIIQKRIDNE